MNRTAFAIPHTWTIAALVALGAYSSTGCMTEQVGTAGDSAQVGVSDDSITGNMNHTDVKRQSIGNCWTYAVAGWAESLNKRAGGTGLNTSESYMSYWYWFEQIANEGTSSISTGGFWDTAMELYARYGLMAEADFLPNEGGMEMSAAQKTALARVNEALKSGELKDPKARADRAKVRAVLNRAFNLSADRIKRLDAVFGPGVSRTLDRDYVTALPGNGVVRAVDVAVVVPDAVTHAPIKTTLADAAGHTGSTRRFSEAYYGSQAASQRTLQQRVQRALHDGAPVTLTWFVEFNALTSASVFSKAELDRRGPGHQGFHMTVMDDYQATLANGRVLAAGVPASAADMELALQADTKIDFLRVKNSWGKDRPDRWTTAAKAGYHDLEMAYLNGPVKRCAEKNGETDVTNCKSTIRPLQSVILPAGY
jgi:hypothetical protein